MLEVERAEQEFDLYYSEDGVLLREVPDRDGNDDHGDMLPQELSKAISDFIARKYPGARIVDAEREKGNTEVDIIFAGKRSRCASVRRRLAVDENRSAPFGGSGRGEADFAVIAVRYVGDRRC